MCIRDRPISSLITLSLCFLIFDWPGLRAFWILFVVEVFFNRLASGSSRCFTSFWWRCLGKSNIVGGRFAFVGSGLPSKCLEHIRVCLVTFRLSSWHAAIHLRLLSCSLIPGAYCFSFVIWWKTMKSNTCNFRVFDWVLFLCFAVGTVVGTAVMFRHFLAKSTESLDKHRTPIRLFPALTLHSLSRATRPRTVREYEYCLLFLCG